MLHSWRETRVPEGGFSVFDPVLQGLKPLSHLGIYVLIEILCHLPGFRHEVFVTSRCLHLTAVYKESERLIDLS